MTYYARSVRRWAPIAARSGRRYYGRALRRTYARRGRLNPTFRRRYAMNYSRRRMLYYY